jgi:hypothetical protein
MTPPAPAPPGAAPAELHAAVVEEAGYYQAVEEFFVSRRGDPLFLSSADWLLVRAWRRAGLPLRVVLRGIADALDAHAHSFARARKVGSLRYCEPSVDAAVERWRRALAGGAETSAWQEPTDALLERAAACDAARALPPALVARVQGLARALRKCAAAPGDRRELEAWLVRNEVALVAALARAQAGPLLDAVHAQIEAELQPYAARLPAKVLEQVRAEALARHLLGRHGLPRLSLLQE